jgi:S-adenosylmethionine hydrolase
MPKKFLVPISDCTDIAEHEIRAMLLAKTRHDNDIQVEPVVPIRPPLSLMNAMFATRLMADAYPEDTTFLVAINPERDRHISLVGRTERKNLGFVARDHGVLTWLARDFGIAEVYNVDRNYGPTATNFIPFSGKNVSAPLAARVASGAPLQELGEPIDAASMTRLDLPAGTIVHIDNFGLMKFTGSLDELGLKEDDAVEVTLNGRTVKATYARRMMRLDTGLWAVYPGSSFGLPELGKVRMSGVAELDAKVGDRIEVTKLDA